MLPLAITLRVKRRLKAFDKVNAWLSTAPPASPRETTADYVASFSLTETFNAQPTSSHWPVPEVTLWQVLTTDLGMLFLHSVSMQSVFEPFVELEKDPHHNRNLWSLMLIFRLRST